MEWHFGRFALTVVAAGIAASLTDWLFMGVLFHDRYLATPEIWRGQARKPETRRIVLSSLLGLLSCAVFIFFTEKWHLHSLSAALKLAAAMWVAAPVPILFINAVWMKFDPRLAFSHSLGWLARFAATAFAATYLMH